MDFVVPDNFTTLAATLYDYGAPAIGLLLIFVGLFLLKPMKNARNESERSMFKALVFATFIFSFVLFGGGVILRAMEGSGSQVCLPWEANLSILDKQIKVFPSAKFTFTKRSDTNQTGVEYKIVGLNKNEEIRFKIINRLPYYENERQRSLYGMDRSIGNVSKFTVKIDENYAPCQTIYMDYVDNADIIVRTGVEEAIKPKRSEDSGFFNSHAKLDISDGNLFGGLISSAIAAEGKVPKFQSLMNEIRRENENVFEYVIEALWQNMDAYKDGMRTYFTGDSRTPERDFVIVAASRAYLRNQIFERQKEGDTSRLSPFLTGDLIDAFIELAVSPASAVRLNARAVLRTGPSKEYIDKFISYYKEKYSGDSDQWGQDKVLGHVSLSYTGLDALYNYAYDIVTTIQGENNKNQSKDFGYAYEALTFAKTLFEQVPVEYKIDFLKANYGKAMFWYEVAKITSANNSKISFLGFTGIGPKKALGYMDKQLTFLLDNANALKEYGAYLKVHHIQQAEKCLAQQLDMDVKKVEQCFAMFAP